MNDARILAGCVAFQGKMVVSGGNVNIYDHSNNLNTVEAYCNVDNTWSAMPFVADENIVIPRYLIKIKSVNIFSLNLMTI